MRWGGGGGEEEGKQKDREATEEGKERNEGHND